ncbi:glucosamine inositolphosphorylceramide transferase family protein [Pseudactinotalea sp. Z1739]|uniref:glucosamine inositolphosphorylceramide transferase family protein n=1 Tax=Pseudactinotalea sp. Z1739 TaxID=3413028 RepID=UPI003C797B5F
MQLEVILDEGAQRRWHHGLLRRLDDLPGVTVTVRLRPVTPAPDARRLGHLMRLETLLHRLEPGGFALEAVHEAGFPERVRTDPAAAVLDLTEEPAQNSWTVRYDGKPGEQALVDAVRSGRLPQVSVTDGAGAVRASGRPGSEQPGLLTTALADVTTGVVTLVEGAVIGRPFTAPTSDGTEATSPAPFGTLARRRIAGAAIRQAYRRLYRAPHWRVGWRRVHGPGVVDLGELPSGWREVPDDGYHFYADPFLFEHEGTTFMFVEDFDHRVGKGVISVSEWGEDGPVGTPRPVLRHEVHLSYPFVLDHDGKVWMIPETSGAGTVELYRATRFPDEWELEKVLIEGLEVSDATPFRRDGRWWLAGTVRTGGSFSDSLHLWSAPDLLGPWTPHRANPVLIDIASARPAGRVVERDGRLLRPVQDGRDGYGAALAIAEVTRLDDDGFDQRVIAHLTPGTAWPGRYLHTLNSCGDLEILDGSRFSPRFALLRRLPGSPKV